MKIWILVIIYGISGWGYGWSRHVEFPNEVSCHKALESMRVTGQNQSSGDDDEQIIAYCQPEQGEE